MRMFAGFSLCVGLASGILAGCANLEPYANHLVFNATGAAQQPAAITFSDPQLFARETLINDRAAEAELIDSLLAQSAEPSFAESRFTSQLNRNVESIFSLTTQLEATFDEPAARRLRRDDQVHALESRLALLDLQRRIAQAESDLANVGSKVESASGDDATDTGSDTSTAADGEPASGTTGGTPDTTQSADSAADLAAVLKRTEEILTTIKARTAEEVHANAAATSQSPEDLFLDLDAYRSVLRQRKAALSLDDLHDLRGNSLYRFQFQATVLPGEAKDQVGVSRITVLPPKLNEFDIQRLYLAWLTHVALRLNQPYTQVRDRDCPTASEGYLRLVGTGLFHLLEVTWVKNDKHRVTNVHVRKAAHGLVPRNPRKNECRLLVPMPLALNLDVLFEPRAQERPTGVAPMVSYFLTVFAMLRSDTRIFELQRLRFADPTFQFHRNQGGFSNFVALEHSELFRWATDASRGNGGEHTPHLYDLWKTDQFPRVRIVPEAFRDAVVRRGVTDWAMEKAQCTQAANSPQQRDRCFIRRYVAQGRSAANATLPVQSTQRFSTIARSTASMEAALALSGKLLSGLNSLSARVGMLRQAAGTVEALARQPLVVGFADRIVESASQGLSARNDGIDVANSSALLSPVQKAQVGWVFGPRIKINTDTETLELEHTLAHHNLAADISLPGWWPYVDMQVESAWVENWHAGAVFSKSTGAGQKPFRVALPTNVADLDGLTNYLATRTIGTNVKILSVREVQPFYLSACEDEVTLRIEGANVWRSPQVFLAGRAGSNVQVLPNMEGVSATFNLKNVLEVNNTRLNDDARQRVPLSVWTRDGTDTLAIPLYGRRTKSGCSSPSTLATATQPGRLRVYDVSPSRVRACAKAAFIARLDQVGHQTPEFLLAGQRSTGQQKLGRAGRMYRVEFSKSALTAAAGTAASLTVTDGRSMDTATIAVDACTPPKKPVSGAQSAASKAKTSLERRWVVDLDAAPEKWRFRIPVKPATPVLTKDTTFLGILPSSASGDGYVQSFEAPWKNPADGLGKKTVSAGFDFKRPDHLRAHFDDGKTALVLRVAVVKPQGKKAAKVIEKLTDAVVIYPHGQTPKLVPPSTPQPLASTFTLQAPEKSEVAFPRIGAAEMYVNLTGANAGKLALVPSPLAPKLGKAGKLELSVKLKDPKDIAKWKALGKPVEVELGFAGPANELPSSVKLLLQ